MPLTPLLAGLVKVGGADRCLAGHQKQSALSLVRQLQEGEEGLLCTIKYLKRPKLKICASGYICTQEKRSFYVQTNI